MKTLAHMTTAVALMVVLTLLLYAEMKLNALLTYVLEESVSSMQLTLNVTTEFLAL